MRAAVVNGVRLGLGVAIISTSNGLMTDKDAARNTVAGQTVEPLPFHGMDDARYGDPGQMYPDDEASRRFREKYLTREGGPGEFLDALRSSPAASADRRP